ncbi:DNA topoisomerase-3 [Terribacillus saccharophilus]|uniref:DNA topoisomerase n=1 Tax=Terribacillus saccharophilus TaxID=361277 RepID=A0AAX2EJQ0_9BACI|nr:DNA topoisomerase-3 [Terribacillus saccharophilus]
MSQLFVCEKPSVASDLAMAISGGYEKAQGYLIGKDGKIFTYAFGHLVSCVSPETINEDWGWRGNVHKLPFFKKNIPLAVIDNPEVKKQYNVVVSLMKKADLIYIATDAGREGEHIFRKIYSLSGVKKPLKRLWIQDMTQEGLQKAFHNVKDGSEYDGLAMAAKLREESDLMIGMNATMMVTKLSKSPKVLSLGRVQTPTLAMVVSRDKTIENFSKVVHYTIAAMDKNDEKYELVLDKDTHLPKGEAQIILDSLSNRINFTITSNLKDEKPQKLFSLTELQKHMNKKYKWGAEHTLNTTQKLYEKKVVTYPRTNSQYIANGSELPALLQKHTGNEVVDTIVSEGYEMEASFINPEKVTDHEAIIITSKVAENLAGDEAILYDVIRTRFLAAFYPYAQKEETVATFQDGEHTFKAKESVLVTLGWKALYGEALQEASLKHTDLSDVGEYMLVEKETKPPQRYTEGTLLNDMEHAAKFLEGTADKQVIRTVEGIGTSATRAAIIEKLVERGFIEKNKNQIISTALGRELIGMMPSDFSLYSVQLTAFFESMLAQIEQNELSPTVFYEELEGLLQQTAREIKGNVKTLASAKPATKEVIVECPKCKKPIYENSKGYSCSGYKEGCKITVWKNGLAKLGKSNITKNEATKLLSGKVVKVTLKSKRGSWKAEVRHNTENNWIEFAE